MMVTVLTFQSQEGALVFHFSGLPWKSGAARSPLPSPVQDIDVNSNFSHIDINMEEHQDQAVPFY